MRNGKVIRKNPRNKNIVVEFIDNLVVQFHVKFIKEVHVKSFVIVEFPKEFFVDFHGKLIVQFVVLRIPSEIRFGISCGIYWHC